MSSVLRRSTQENEKTTGPSILIDDSEYNTVNSNRQLLSSRTDDQGVSNNCNNNAESYIVEVSDLDYLRRITESSDSSYPEEDDDDDLLQQDTSQWDIFEDYHKFELREQKLKELKRKEAAKEIQIMQE